MRQHPRTIEIDQNELAATANPDDAAALYFAIEGGPAFAWDKLRQEDLSRQDSAAHDHVAQRANDVLDFRELRHAWEFDLRGSSQSSPPGGKGKKGYPPMAIVFGCASADGP